MLLVIINLKIWKVSKGDRKYKNLYIGVFLLIREDIELRKFKSHVKYVLRKDFYKNRIVKGCPICGGSHYIKHGLYKEIQRYKCKN